jgi:hypothetical protein
MSDHVPSFRRRYCQGAGGSTVVPAGQRWQLFATEGLQLRIMLHATAAPEESGGHGSEALHACVHTSSALAL